MDGDSSRVTTFIKNKNHLNDRLDGVVKSYKDIFEEDLSQGNDNVRRAKYTDMINQFYDLVTDFYEYGWGQSFHFAPRHKGESFLASLARHEMYLGYRLGLGKGMRVLDLGCGVGGPQRCIARFTSANIVGVNNNDYQLSRARALTKQQGLAHLCSYLKADFMHLPLPDSSVDGAFHVEALCHAPDRVAIFREILRVLKPGAHFGGYDWVVTPRYDPSNPEHVRIKNEIEIGNGLPTIQTIDAVVGAMREAGFEVIEVRDTMLQPHEDSDEGNSAAAASYSVPWYEPLSGSLSVSGFKHTRLGRLATHAMVYTLETLRLAPRGTTATSGILCAAADALVKSGQLGIFTPGLFYLARKPE